MEKWDRRSLQTHFERQLESVESAIAAHREALANDEISAEDMIAVTRFVTRLEASGVAKSW